MNPDSTLPPPLGQPAAPAGKKHSGLGIASFIIGVGGGIIMFGLVAYAGMLNVRGATEQSSAVMLVGLMIIGLCLVHLLGLGLGIASLFQSDRRKVFAVIGLAINTVIIACVVGLMALGLAIKNRRASLRQTWTENSSASSRPSATRVTGPVIRIA